MQFLIKGQSEAIKLAVGRGLCIHEDEFKEPFTEGIFILLLLICSQFVTCRYKT